ncbi:MAG: undecaprenyl-phosphate glucose phosphotransferase, partial [Parvularculaceae bacterium]|nr:undecaprenyl-phosphate glucose phosphotransferase [Parvularculaceae bacterium]
PPRSRSSVARSVYGDIVQATDFMLVVAASMVAAIAYLGFILQTPYDLQRYGAAGILGATAVTALLRRDGYYDFSSLLTTKGAVRAVVANWTGVVVGLIAFGYALKAAEGYSRVWLVSWGIISAVALISSRAMAARVLRHDVARGESAFMRRIAIVGSNDTAEAFAEIIRGSDEAVQIAGIFAADARSANAMRGFDLTGDLEALARLARSGQIDDIVIAQPTASAADIDALVNRLSILPVTISICPQYHWLRHTGGEVSRIGRAPVLNLYRRPLEGWGSLLKALEDRILGTILLVAVSPLLLLIAIAVMVQGKGPIFFSQQRHGFNHSVFRIYKFRTMTVAEDGAKVVQASVNDARITPVGRFLRRYSLDELPQLLNVVKGDMSLVGPRPHALAHNHQYAQTIENYSGRHKVKPGITGWAQVNGFRGETSETERMADRVRYDLEYIDNWSLWFDVKILAMTIFAVLSPKNAH